MLCSSTSLLTDNFSSYACGLWLPSYANPGCSWARYVRRCGLWYRARQKNSFSLLIKLLILILMHNGC